MRLTSLALATGTLVVAGTSAASAATTTTTTQRLSAEATGSALELKVYLPTDVPGLTTNHLLDLKVSFTDGKALLNGATKDLSSIANLAQSSSSVLNGVLAKTAQASMAGSPSQDASLFGPATLPLGLGSAAVGPVHAEVGSLTSSTLALGHSNLASLTLVPTGIGLAGLPSVTSTLTSTLNGALGTASGTVTSVVNTAVGTLTNTLNQLPAGSTLAPTLTSTVNTLTSTLSSLTSTLTSLSSAKALVSLDGVDQAHTLTKVGKAVTAASSSSIADVNVLNGLVSIQGLTSAVQATAGGTAGTAKVSFPAVPVLKVSVANGAATLLLDATGIHLGGALAPVNSTVSGVTNTALNAVNSALNSLAGVSVNYGKAVVDNAASDGTAAAGHVSATTVTIDPSVLHTANLVPAGVKFMTLSFVPVSAAVQTTLVPAAATTVPTVIVKATPHTLAYTGANFTLTAGAATGLVLLGAYALRRRRSSEV